VVLICFSGLQYNGLHNHPFDSVRSDNKHVFVANGIHVGVVASHPLNFLRNIIGNDRNHTLRERPFWKDRHSRHISSML